VDLLILGASARSAASSALRIGLRPTCADLFADADLASACPSTRIEPDDYPDGLARFAEGLEATPWLYTGSIENRPDLVGRISGRHPLLGNSPATLRAVRDPFALAGAVRDAGLVAPAVRPDPTGLPLDGSWLVKPIASGGGRGIRPWSGEPPTVGRSVYFQERIEGRSLAALFVGEERVARLLGITRQYLGRPGNRFAYRGSLGPWPVAPAIRGQIERLGRAIASAFGLIGLFGVDLILGDGRAWPIEVNPRYTASVEVLEWALGRSLLADHLRAFGVDVEALADTIEGGGCVAKAIVHADRPCLWPRSGMGPSDPGHFPEVADIPRPGTRFDRGDPVLTVFARGSSPEECRRRLASRVRAWRLGLRGESG
jgi:predicted ATP-grasp superfamily ATP-dependent carboligase